LFLIARALAQINGAASPAAILLDEPTASLDPSGDSSLPRYALQRMLVGFAEITSSQEICLRTENFSGAIIFQYG